MKNISHLLKSSLIVAVLAVMAIIPSAYAGGNEGLGQAYVTHIRGDAVLSGVGSTGAGQGTIVVTTVPTGAHVRKAFLYWATIGANNTWVSPTINGTTVSGHLIGTSADTCWGAPSVFAYRADVTPLVAGNGMYIVAGLPVYSTDGDDSEGATLIIIYALAGAPERTIVINDGSVTLNGTRTVYTDTINGFTPNSPLTNARVTYVVGDGQSEYDDGDVTFGGSVVATNVFSGTDGAMWDTLGYDVTGLLGTAPVTTTLDAHNESSDDYDCLQWVATVFSVTSLPLDKHVFLPLAMR